MTTKLGGGGGALGKAFVFGGFPYAMHYSTSELL